MSDQPQTPSGRLSPGDTAPDFTLPTDTGEEVSLSGLRGRKVIVYFYPAAMTPGCTTQACDFTDSLDSLRDAGYEVLGISPDKPEKLAKFRERDALTLTLPDFRLCALELGGPCSTFRPDSPHGLIPPTQPMLLIGPDSVIPAPELAAAA